MKKLILASASALAMLTLAACSDSTDQTTTSSSATKPVTNDGTGGATASGTAGGAGTATPQDGPVNATTDNNTTQSIETGTDKPESGTGGASQTTIDSNTQAVQPKAPPASSAQ